MGFRWFYIFGVTEGLSALCRKGLVCVAVREWTATKERLRLAVAGGARPRRI